MYLTIYSFVWLATLKLICCPLYLYIFFYFRRRLWIVSYIAWVNLSAFLSIIVIFMVKGKTYTNFSICVCIVTSPCKTTPKFCEPHVQNYLFVRHCGPQYLFFIDMNKMGGGGLTAHKFIYLSIKLKWPKFVNFLMFNSLCLTSNKVVSLSVVRNLELKKCLLHIDRIG